MKRRTFLKGMLATGIASTLPINFSIAQRERHLTIGINADPGTLDPHHAAGSIVGNRYHGFVHDSLARLRADGTLEPMLAVDWQNEDRRWRFTLREGVRFHDGSILTAEDAAYSLNRLLFSDQPSQIRASFAPYVASVEVAGPLELVVTTPAFDPLLPLRLASVNAAILSAEATETMGFDAVQTGPLGAGPFQIVAFESGRRLELEVHSEYWMGRPDIERVTVEVIPENATRVAALQSGEIDMMTTLPPDLVTQVNNASGLRVDDVLLYNYMLTYFNTFNGPTANVDVRRALSLAIDREGISEALWGGRVRVMNDYFLPGEFAHDPNRLPFAFDPEAAQRLLEASGYAGEVLEFTPPSDYYTNGRLVTDVISEMWRAIGVNVDYTPLETAQWAERSLTGAQIATLQSFGTQGDPATNSAISNYRDDAWISQYYRTDETFKRLADEAAALLDEDARRSIYRELADILDRDVPFAPLYQSIELYGVRDGITWEPHLNFYIDLRPGRFSFSG